MRNLQNFVTSLTAKIKRALLEDEAALTNFRKNSISYFTGNIQLAKQTKHTNQVVQLLRLIGMAIKCGIMLRTALNKKWSYASLDVFGFEIDLLGDIENSPMLWSALPHAVSASLCCANEFWKSADYITRLDAHSNNAHLLACAITAVLKKTQDEKNLRNRELDFLASFSSVLLEMKRLQTSEFKDWPLRGISIFMDVVVKESSTLHPKDLDLFLPFPVIQAAFLDRFLGRIHGFEEGMGAEEFSKKVSENAKAYTDETAEQEEVTKSRKI